jgi:hypothetical protein
MNNAKDTIISQCLSLAKTALGSGWTFHNSTEALFWFRSVLKVDPQNVTARLGSARVYQYIASQPWWHNDVSLAKRAASKALVMLEEPIGPRNVVESRESACLRPNLFSNWAIKCCSKVFRPRHNYRSWISEQLLFSTFQQYLY